MKRQLVAVVLAFGVLGSGIFFGCTAEAQPPSDESPPNSPPQDVLVTYSDLGSSFTPRIGSVPTTTFNYTQFSGTVQWTPNHQTFDAGVSYQATISLTPKSGYTLSGLSSDFFTLDDVVSSTYDPSTDQISAAYGPIAAVGSPGPGGGLIFFDKGTKDTAMWAYDSGTATYAQHPTKTTSFAWRYLEVIPKVNLPPNYTISTDRGNLQWGDIAIKITGAQETALGGGLGNSLAITTYHDEHFTYGPTGSSSSTISAKFCLDLVYPTYNQTDDWYLPSIDELRLMYTNLKLQGLGSFENEKYYSSTDSTANGVAYVLGIDFTNGTESAMYKSLMSIRTRAIRAF